MGIKEKIQKAEESTWLTDGISRRELAIIKIKTTIQMFFIFVMKEILG